MAAGSLFTDLDSRYDLKRKRRYDEADESVNGIFSAKRRNFSQLPIRTSPLFRPTISVTPAFGHFDISPAVLTPDSIPEDDEPHSHHLWLQQQTPTSRPQSSPGSSDSTNYEQFSGGAVQEDTTDMEMEIASPKLSHHPPPIRMGRARSNDLISPVRMPMNHRMLLGATSPTHRTSFAQGRVATPVAMSFPARSPFEASFASANARQMRSHLQTTLSPMANTESWTPQIHHPPSPEPELDSAFSEDATMIGMEDSHMMSSSFGALSVHSQDDGDVSSFTSSPVRARSSQTSAGSMNAFVMSGRALAGDLNETQMTSSGFGDHRLHHQHNRSTSNSTRVARLHMGYKADCEKCVARVPGHYSHIIWS